MSYDFLSTAKLIKFIKMLFKLLERHEVRSQIWEEDLIKGNQIHVIPLKQGFFTWGASNLSGCWNQFQGVLGRSHMWRKKVKGIRLFLLYPCSNQVLTNGRGDGLLRRDQKGCWGRRRLRNAALMNLRGPFRPLFVTVSIWKHRRKRNWLLK